MSHWDIVNPSESMPTLRLISNRLGASNRSFPGQLMDVSNSTLMFLNVWVK